MSDFIGSFDRDYFDHPFELYAIKVHLIASLSKHFIDILDFELRENTGKELQELCGGQQIGAFAWVTWLIN